jgi:methylenetetrahydrofolate reductase (NADPH)
VTIQLGGSTRFEILPFGSVEDEARAQPAPLVISVTCSPRHGVDQTVDVVERIAAIGHQPVPHLAARMIRYRGHIEELLERLAACGVDDVFVIAGDGQEPVGEFASAVELLPIISAHRLRPRRVGIGAYPEGHPLIDPLELENALAFKASLADYMVTQMCFDPDALLGWIEATRTRGIELPAYIGIPGTVDRRKLVEISVRVGVGTSITFLRKQQGIKRLLGRPEQAGEHLHDVVAPLIGDPGLGIAVIHYYTFNRLAATVAWDQKHSPRVALHQESGA